VPVIEVATWYAGRPRPRRHCVRWEPSSPHENGHGTFSHFSAHFALARPPISAAAEHLFLFVIELFLRWD